MSQVPPPPINNPYASPSGGAGDGDPSAAREYAKSRVGTPALLLMITAGIGIAIQLLGIVANVVGAGIGAAAAADQQQLMTQMFSGTTGVIMGMVGIVIGAIVFYGAWNMREAKNWGLSMTAAILAAIPCISPCCLLGLPIGIWGAIVLNDAQVKRGFSA